MDCLSSGVSTRTPWDYRSSSKAGTQSNENGIDHTLNLTASSSCFTRPLGILELKFNQSASNEGQSDIFVCLNVQLQDHSSNEYFWNRLLYSWTRLRAIHPLLASTVQNIEASASDSMNSPYSTKQFHYSIAKSEEESILRSRSQILYEESDEPQVTMDDWIQNKVLNGPRFYLKQDDCLARLLVVRDSSSERLSHRLCLVIAHVISDGISVITILKDLFTILSTPSLPSPLSPPSYRLHKDFISNTATDSLSLPSGELSHLSPWSLLPTLNTLKLVLPLSSEELYPPLSNPSSNISGSSPDSARSNKYRNQWIWAITRVIVDIQHSRFPTSTQFPRIPTPVSGLSQPNTSWPLLKFSKEITSSLILLGKRYSLSLSMLLYAIISVSISTILDSNGSESIIIGFPFSLRPFLALSNHSEVDLAIRITFGSVHFPPTESNLTGEQLKSIVIAYAKSAKAQLTKRIRSTPSSRLLLLSSAHLLNLNRIRTSGGEQTWFKEPRSALNASMIGDLDRILPTSFNLQESKLTLSNMRIGTRLHIGEGMLTEVFTFERMACISIGFDDGIFKKEQVLELLATIERIGLSLAALEIN